MPAKLLIALHTWLDAEARARELDRTIASAVARMDVAAADHAARALQNQRAFSAEMLSTLLDVLGKERGASQRKE